MVTIHRPFAARTCSCGSRRGTSSLRGSCCSWQPLCSSSSPATALCARRREAQPVARQAGPGDGEAEGRARRLRTAPSAWSSSRCRSAPRRSPPRRPAKPIGSATHEGSKPTTPQAPVGAPPAGGAPAPTSATPAAPESTVAVPPSAVPTVDPTLAQVAQATQQQAGNDEAAIRVIVYGAGAQAALASVRATDVTSLSADRAPFAATIKASTLGQLGLATGVTHVVVDSPVKATDSGRLDDRRHEGRHPVPADERRDRRLGPGADRPGHRRRRARQRRDAEPDRPRQPRRRRSGSSGQQRQVEPDDTVGHGTFVSDVLAGQSADGRHVGVAPGANDLRDQRRRRATASTTSDIVNGLTWVLREPGHLQHPRRQPVAGRDACRARTRRARSTRRSRSSGTPASSS